MLDIGGGTSDLLIIQDNIIRHAAVIPFGGNSVTEDIRMGCGVSAKHAEQLKVQHGSCVSTLAPKKSIVIPGIGGRESREISFGVLASIIEARMAEIFEAVDYEIEKSGYKNLLQAGLVITGGTAQMLNICQLANIITGLETRVAYPDESITGDSISEVFAPSQATAVGLILKGFEKMAKEKTVYNTATAINYDIFADSSAEEELVNAQVPENGKQVKEEPKPRKVSIWERLRGSLNTDKMFNSDNNQA